VVDSINTKGNYYFLFKPQRAQKKAIYFFKLCVLLRNPRLSAVKKMFFVNFLPVGRQVWLIQSTQKGGNYA